MLDWIVVAGAAWLVWLALRDAKPVAMPGTPLDRLLDDAVEAVR